MRWLVLRCSGFCLLGLNALQFIFHLFGHCRVNCRVPFCLLNIFLHFFILLDPIRCDALPGHFFHSPQFDTLPSFFFHPPQFNTCLVIFHLLNLLNSAWSYSFSISSIRYSAWSFRNSIIYLVLFSFFFHPPQFNTLPCHFPSQFDTLPGHLCSISSIRYTV